MPLIMIEIEGFPAAKQPIIKAGKEVRVLTNLLKVKEVPDITMYNYVLSIEPEVRRGMVGFMVKNVIENYEDIFKGILVGFDGVRMIVTNKKLKDEVVELVFKIREKEYKVIFELKNTYMLKDILDKSRNDVSSHIQCLELLSRTYQADRFYTEKGKCAERKNQEPVGKGVEIWTGLIQSFKMMNVGICLNVDLSFIPFFEPIELIELVSNLEGRRDLDRMNLPRDLCSNLGRTLKGLKMTTTHRKDKNFTFKLHEITSAPADSIDFETETGKMTVAEYFGKQYGRLKYPNLPCVVVKKGPKFIFFPMEVVKIIPNQKYTKKLSDIQVNNLIKIAAKPPINRFSMIEKKIKELQITENENLKSMGLAFDKDFISSSAKILPPPKVVFANKEITPEKGGWDLRGVSALTPREVKSWVIISLASRRDVPERMLEDGVRDLIRTSKNFGLLLGNNYKIYYVDPRDVSPQTLCIGKVPLALVVLNTRAAGNYAEIKRIAETVEKFTITQCIFKRNVEKLRNPTFASNIALKINAKLGGVNSKVVGGMNLIKNVPTILFGADVSHPGIGESIPATLSAVVASMNNDCTEYATSIKMQPERQDILYNLKDTVREMLIKWRGINKKVPRRIIFYRDGIAESLFHNVFEKEIQAIQEACQSLNKDYKPEINFIIAQKRHSVRFLDDSKAEIVGRRGPTGNVVPGTVVEEICHPKLFEFYLVSHFALQGTARPVLYQILKNDSNLTSLEYQELTHSLSYVYARATKAVSVCSPVYYAHLAAARAKCYTIPDGEKFEMKEPAKLLEDMLYYL
ncbi:Argonaute protein [Spraguea lophii 42_110]|uniref:Argonaute protein n=1 Tax=Spraguea lophii (strain 42_110) TaxID=1358809 RepID=S7WCF7_SPRLO|nr:Argonaute protein [Spraguea lophii 42_110]